VKKALQGEDLAALRDQLRTNAKPLLQAKDTSVDTWKGLIDLPIAKERDTFKNDLQHSGRFWCFVVMMTMALSILAGLCFMARDENPAKANPFPFETSCCQCCVWCNGCCIMISALLIGGIFTLLATPLSGLCLVMEDVSSTTLKSYAPALNMSFEGDSAQALDVIDTCFAKHGDGEILQAVAVESGNGTKTLEQKLRADVRDPIDAAFEQVGKTPDVKLADAPEFQDLLSVIRSGQFVYSNSQSHEWDCDLFKVNGIVCDTKDMRKLGGVWVSDCVMEVDVNGRKEATMERFPRKCISTSQFALYMSQFEGRLTQAVARLDGSTPTIKERVVNDLRSLVERYVLSVLDDVIKYANCKFMGIGYQRVLDGLCRQVATGFTMVGQAFTAMAVFMLFTIITTYYLYRHVQDNRDLYKKGKIVYNKDSKEGKQAWIA